MGSVNSPTLCDLRGNLRDLCGKTFENLTTKYTKCTKRNTKNLKFKIFILFFYL